MRIYTLDIWNYNAEDDPYLDVHERRHFSSKRVAIQEAQCARAEYAYTTTVTRHEFPLTRTTLLAALDAATGVSGKASGPAEYPGAHALIWNSDEHTPPKEM